MKKYVDMICKLIEIPRNELRCKFYETNDEELKKVLDNYEDAYYRSCLKIEEYIDNELKNRDINHHD